MTLGPMDYLAAAYGAAWLLLFGYLWLLHSRQQRLEGELERLESQSD